VRAQRGRLGISLAALSSASGVSFSTLERLEQGRGGCSAVDLWRIAQALGSSISDLCGPSRIAQAAPPPRSFAAQDALDYGGDCVPGQPLLDDPPQSASRKH
jgi:transcriptional regulator with XRE-family HTH domain